MNPPYTHSIEQGLRNLLQGRLLLKANMVAGATTITVGEGFSSPYTHMNIPGSALFQNNTTLATLVQPAAANRKGQIEHQENVTLVLTGPNQLHLTTSAPVTNAYTTARGAYVRLRTLPAVCSKLKFIDTDFLDEALPAPQDVWFPGVIVEPYQVSAEPFSTAIREYKHRIVVRYAVVMDDSYSRAGLREDLEQLCDLIEQDYRLGATCYYSVLDQPWVLNPTPGRVQNRMIATANEHRIDWGDIYLTAHRLVVVDKTGGAV